MVTNSIHTVTIFLLVSIMLALAAKCTSATYTFSHSRTRVHASIVDAFSDSKYAATLFHVVIRLHELPLSSLSFPPNASRQQTREAVALHLQQHRQHAQAAVRKLLSSSSCEFFWITNRISCLNLTPSVLRALAQHSHVAAIHPPSAMRRPLPVHRRTASNSNAPLQHATSLQPNIHQVLRLPPPSPPIASQSSAINPPFHRSELMKRGLRLKVKTSPLQSSMVALATRTNHCSRLTVAVEVAEMLTTTTTGSTLLTITKRLVGCLSAPGFHSVC
jgi:hypothetical protein